MRSLFLIIFFSLLQVANSAELGRTSISWQLGPESSTYNLDIGINRSSTLGVHYQQQFAEQRDSKTTYMLQGLNNYGINYEYFMGPDRERFKSGIVLSAGLHYTKLSESSIHQIIIFEGKQKLESGKGLAGGRLAANYRWYSKSLFAGAGVEGSRVGSATIFLPIKIQLGVVF